MDSFSSESGEAIGVIVILQAVASVTVSYHNPGELFPIGTLKGMIDDAGWKDEDLERLGLL